MLRRALRGHGRSLLSRALSSGFTPKFESVPREKADVVVIGAGVVGLAVARALTLKGRDVLVIESAPTFGTGTSSRNSEVIHAGIYYPRGSLKASLCVRGRKMLYDYCMDRGIPHKRLGKLIVAVGPAEILKLSDLLRRGLENGVEGLMMMDGSEAMRLEPELYCTKALLSPCSGIVDSHSLMLSLLGDAENQKTTISFNTTVIGGHIDGAGIHLYISESRDLENYADISSVKPQLIMSPKLVINSAGLSALPLAKSIHGLNIGTITPHYARGCYFTHSKTKVPPFSHLIYPIPEDGGLGVHATVDLDGHLKFGPDVEWMMPLNDISAFLNRFDYSVHSNRASKFYSEIRKYYPNLKDKSLEPGYAGIRPKLSGPGETSSDFVIQGEDIHGISGLINLFGIESPGLTSSLAIAEYIVSKIPR